MEKEFSVITKLMKDNSKNVSECHVSLAASAAEIVQVFIFQRWSNLRSKKFILGKQDF